TSRLHALPPDLLSPSGAWIPSDYQQQLPPLPPHPQLLSKTACDSASYIAQRIRPTVSWRDSADWIATISSGVRRRPKSTANDCGSALNDAYWSGFVESQFDTVASFSRRSVMY